MSDFCGLGAFLFKLTLEVLIVPNGYLTTFIPSDECKISEAEKIHQWQSLTHDSRLTKAQTRGVVFCARPYNIVPYGKNIRHGYFAYRLWENGQDH